MIEQIICEKQAEEHYKLLNEERKLKYNDICKKALNSPINYILSVDLPHPAIKDKGCVTKYKYGEYLQGNKVIEDVECF